MSATQQPAVGDRRKVPAGNGCHELHLERFHVGPTKGDLTRAYTCNSKGLIRLQMTEHTLYH